MKTKGFLHSHTRILLPACIANSESTHPRFITIEITPKTAFGLLIFHLLKYTRDTKSQLNLKCNKGGKPCGPGARFRPMISFCKACEYMLFFFHVIIG